LLFFIGNEGLSILENASNCGLPVPKKLKDTLAQFTEIKAKK
jgi:phage-related holin